MEYKRKKYIVLREIHNQFFLINICCNYHNNVCSLYEVNEMGAYIWKALSQTGKSDVIAKNLLGELNDGVTFRQLLDDIETFLEKLAECGFIERII